MTTETAEPFYRAVDAAYQKRSIAFCSNVCHSGLGSSPRGSERASYRRGFSASR